MERLFRWLMPNEAEKIQVFQQAMIDYWERHGRHNLPWRSTDDAWRILLAEVLLRKTTSAQAAGVYTQLSGYTPYDIVSLDIEELAKILNPLGIHYVRAEQLKSISQIVIDTNGEVLKSDELLRSLPGVGRYISNSVRCCAFGEPLPAMDTNLIRVMDRVFGWTSPRKRPREDRNLWKIAEKLVPEDKPREFNWGMLDFASAICTHRKPKCEMCPINDICDYYSAIRQKNSLERGE
jgi:A/G-specific adenine glycosylase